MIITISGRSASGKDTLAKLLLEQYPKAARIESVTTRKPRSNEGSVGYTHVSDAEFDTLKTRGEFLWDVAHGGNRYGTRASAVADTLSGNGLYFPILLPNAVTHLHRQAVFLGKKHLVRSIYLFTTDPDALVRRMRERGDAEHSIQERMRQEGEWDETARADPNRFLFIEAESHQSEKFRKALWWITADIQSSWLRKNQPRCPLLS